MTKIPESEIKVKRLYRKDMAEIHRRHYKQHSKRRSKAQEKVPRYNFSYIMNVLQILKLLIFQSHLGEEVIRTNYEWLAQNLNQLRSPEEKQLSPRSLERPFKALREVLLAETPLIKVYAPKKRYKDHQGLPAYRTNGLEISIPSINNFLIFYYRLYSNYYFNLMPDLKQEEIHGKIMHHIKEVIHKTDHKNTRKLGDLFAGTPVDKLQEGTNLRAPGDLFAGTGGLICGLYIKYLTNTYVNKYIPSPCSGVSLNDCEERRERENIPKPRNQTYSPDGEHVSEKSLKTAKELFGTLTVRDKPEFVWEEDCPGDKEALGEVADPGGGRRDGSAVGTGPCLDLDYGAVPENIRHAVNTKILEHEQAFNPIKHDLGLFRKAVRDIVGVTISALQGDLNPSKAKLMGAANYAVLDYLEKARLYGFDERPTLWRPPPVPASDPVVAMSYLNDLRRRLN